MTPQLEQRSREISREGYYRTRAQHVTIKTRRNPYQWAQDERWIAQGASPLSMHGDIRYDASRMPWCVEPMVEAVGEDVQITVLQWAAAMAKTEVVVNIIGQSIHEEPKNIIVAYPIEQSRDKFSRDVIQRSLIDATPAIRSLVVTNGGRDSGNTIAYKKFPGGSLNMIAAGSPSNFRGPRAGLAYGDEIDAMPDDVGGEGDPIGLLFKRCEGFASSIKMLSGTPTIKSHSRIESWLLRSDYRKWFVPCRACGHQQVLMFEQIRAPKGKPEEAVLLCSKCDTEHSDKQRVRMVMDGKWLPTAPFSGIRGYWINGMNSTLPAEKGFKTKLHQFVVDAERAMEKPETKKVWTNTFRAETSEPQEDTEQPPEWKPIFERRESYVTVPREALVITAMVDMQVNRLEIEWKAWARDEQSWGLAHTVLDGNPREFTDSPDNVWLRMVRELQRRFPHDIGCDIGLSMAFVDGGWQAEWIYVLMKWLANNPPEGIAGKIRASKGIGKHAEPIMSRKWAAIARNLKGYHIGTWEAKDLIYQRLRAKVGEDGAFPIGYIHHPMSYTENYFQQLTSECVTVVQDKGQEIRKYVNPTSARNEALDLAVGNLAAFKLRTWNFDAIEAEMIQRAEDLRGIKKEVIAAPRTYVSGRGWSL